MMSRSRLVGALALAIAAGACARNGGVAPSASRLMPDAARLEAASPVLRARLTASPIAYFRFMNQAWTREVCTAFEDSLGGVPDVRLHGDAHVEQYAVTAVARGLDDFDDSARGPAVVDIVRFLGSLELTARDRGWDAALPSIEDAFFDGYRRALADASYLPPLPAVAARLRAAPARPPDAFISWADSLMWPGSPADRARFDAAWRILETYAAKSDPVFTPAYLKVRQVGWLRLGVGSALSRKVLVRVEGPSAAPADDVILEAKEVVPLGNEACLSVPRNAEVFRVVEGVRQIGRIDHRLLVALPRLPDSPVEARGWWVRTWDRTYRELEIADLASAEELREVARDAGAQLGATNLSDAPRPVSEQKRVVELETVTRLEPQMREVAHALTVALLEAWQRFSRK
jgi:uncharacterized protein (DUF2252 family)